MTWAVPGGSYRGQGVWVRYTNGTNQFSPISEAQVAAPSLSVSPASMIFLAALNQRPPAQLLHVQRGECSTFNWQASDDTAWLQSQVNGDIVQVSVNPAGLGVGTYQGTLTVTASNVSGISPVSVPVTLIVVDQLYRAYLPVLLRQ